jgi:hypothetical protein
MIGKLMVIFLLTSMHACTTWRKKFQGGNNGKLSRQKHTMDDDSIYKKDVNRPHVSRRFQKIVAIPSHSSLLLLLRTLFFFFFFFFSQQTFQATVRLSK